MAQICSFFTLERFCPVKNMSRKLREIYKNEVNSNKMTLETFVGRHIPFTP